MAVGSSPVVNLRNGFSGKKIQKTGIPVKTGKVTCLHKGRRARENVMHKVHEARERVEQEERRAQEHVPHVTPQTQYWRILIFYTNLQNRSQGK